MKHNKSDNGGGWPESDNWVRWGEELHEKQNLSNMNIEHSLRPPAKDNVFAAVTFASGIYEQLSIW